MRVTNCFYIKFKSTTKTERISAMTGNLGLEVSILDRPHGVLKLKNIAAKKNTQEKLENSGLFDQVTFLRNFMIEQNV